MKNEKRIMTIAAPKVPIFKALCGSLSSFVLTKNVPSIETTMPTKASKSGKITRLTETTAPRIIAPIIEPTYDSKRSAPIPATSPTLSPTLSAITAGLRGSSSGIPASTFPTKSAPISAAFVKIPPPTLANNAIDDAPKLNPLRIGRTNVLRTLIDVPNFAV